MDCADQGAAISTSVLVAVLVPAVALGLYLKVGQPDFPPKDASLGAPPLITAEEREKAARDDALIPQLRARLQMMEPHAAHTLEGYEVLGRAELSRGRLPEAAAAWKVVLADQFDATLAVQTAPGCAHAFVSGAGYVAVTVSVAVLELIADGGDTAKAVGDDVPGCASVTASEPAVLATV